MKHDAYKKRRNRLRQLLKKDGVEAMLVTNPVNVTYLSGFTGEDSFILIAASSKGDLLLSDPRFEVQIGEECPGLPVFIRDPVERLLPAACLELKSRQLSNLVIEGSAMSVLEFDYLQDSAGIGEIRKSGVAVEDLRAIKDSSEIALLRKAVVVAEHAFRAVTSQLRGGQTELEVAHAIESTIRSLGGSGCSFKPIVAVGARAALPHAPPGETLVGSDKFVLIDWGATVAGYRSDLTRVLVTSRIPAKLERIYVAVQEAQEAAIEAIKPGVLASTVDAAARKTLEKAGMGKRFSHGLGHGIGLDIHEGPRMSRLCDTVLQPGMVVTVEPGAYFPGFGGVRIEDDILVTAAGCERLSTLPRDLSSNQIELL